MTNQSDRQADARSSTSTSLTYEGDSLAYFDSQSIPAGDYNGRLLAWINQALGTSYTEINGAKTALANNISIPTWDGLNLLGRSSTSLVLAPVGNRNQLAGSSSGNVTSYSSVDPKWNGSAPVTGVVLRFPWFFVTSGAVETLIGNGTTATAAIEYPSGTRTQCFARVGGTTTLTITDGSNLDMVCAVNIPANAKFWVHLHLDMGGTGKFPMNIINSSTTGDRNENNSTDKTMVGTVTANVTAAPGGANAFSPFVAGYIPATASSYIGIGDSIMAGAHEIGASTYVAALDSFGNVGWFEKKIHGVSGYSFWSMARASSAAFQWAGASAMTRRLDLIREMTNSVLIDSLGHNDMGLAPATTATNQGTILGQFSGKVKKRIVATCTPYTLSTVSVTALTSVSTTATAQVPDASSISNGQSIAIAGGSPSAYNGTYAVTPTDGTHFTYTFAGGTSPATGTITWSDMWASTTNQTQVNTNNDTYNGTVRSVGITGQDGFWEVGSPFVVTGPAGNVWPVNGTPNVYTDDGVHPLTPAVTLALTTMAAPPT